MDLVLLAAVWGGSFLVLLWMRGRRRRKQHRAREPAAGLDRPLLRLGGGDWTARHLCQGCLTLGQTGSGKSSGPMRALLQACLSVGGAMLLCSKPEDRSEYLKTIRRMGRESDVILVDGGESSARLNFMSSVMGGVDADRQTLAALGAAAFEQFTELAGRSRGKGDDSAFWQRASNRLVTAALHALLASDREPSILGVLKICQSLPQTPADLTSPAWQGRFLNQVMRDCYRRLGPGEEFQHLSDYLLGEMAALSGKTKSVIVEVVNGAASAASTGVIGRVIGSDSTFDLGRAIENSAVVLVDLTHLDESARYGAVAIKYLAQRAVLKRRVTPASPVFSIVVDEYQQLVTRSDWSYVSRSRSYRGPMVVATQGIESLRSELGGDQARDEIDALVSNLGTKFVTLPTFPTSEWCSAVIGKTRVRMHGASASAGAYQTPMDLIVPQQGQQAQASASFSEVFESLVRPEDLSGMRCGGPGNNFLVDALVLQAGRAFPDTGLPFCFATFKQK